MTLRFALPACLTFFLLLRLPALGADARPNILLIVADDMGWGELGCQGNPEIPTPNIDGLAARGVRFTNAYVTAPICSPSRAGFLTGRYQQRFGHEFNAANADNSPPNFGLSLQEKTIGDRLKSAGYATGWFGKSHLGYRPEFHPLRRGFDEFYGFLASHHDYLDGEPEPGNPIYRDTAPVEHHDYLTEEFAQAATTFIGRHPTSPWFVYLPFNAVHMPLQATDKYLARFPHISDPKRRTFAAMLSALDDAVGVVLAKVNALGQDETTLVIFISDNGGPTGVTTSSNGILRGGKGNVFEGGIREPFILRWPGRLPAGRIDARPVISLDILPTALAAAGVSVPAAWRIDGVNLLPFLTGQNSAAPHEALYWRYGRQMAIRMGDWKLVKAGTGPVRELLGTATAEGASLYRLSDDPSEQHDLAPQQPEKVRALAAAWQKWNAELVSPAWGPGNDRTRNAATK
jgi:arylsulfatase A-like enzyme